MFFSKQNFNFYVFITTTHAIIYLENKLLHEKSKQLVENQYLNMEKICMNNEHFIYSSREQLPCGRMQIEKKFNEKRGKR